MHAYTQIYKYTHMCTTAASVFADVYVGVKIHLCNVHTCPCIYIYIYVIQRGIPFVASSPIAQVCTLHRFIFTPTYTSANTLAAVVHICVYLYISCMSNNKSNLHFRSKSGAPRDHNPIVVHFSLSAKSDTKGNGNIPTPHELQARNKLRSCRLKDPETRQNFLVALKDQASKAEL